MRLAILNIKSDGQPNPLVRFPAKAGDSDGGGILLHIWNLGFVSLKVFDILGKEVKTLVNEIKQPGTNGAEFNGSNLASGIYFYKLVVSLSNMLEAGSFVQKKRMLLLK